MLRYRLSTIVLGGALAIAAGIGCRKEQASVPPPASPPQEFKQTAVLPHLEGPIVPGKNYVYCATFQLAWNELQNGVLGEPVALADAPPIANDLIAGGDITAEILPPGSHLVKAGWIKDGVIKQIRDEMQRRFPTASFNLPANSQQQAAVAFAYLQQWLAFREAFDRLEACEGMRREAMQMAIVIGRIAEADRLLDLELRTPSLDLAHVANTLQLLRVAGRSGGTP